MPTDLIPKIQGIVKGQIKYTSSSLALNLLIARLQKQYKLNENDAELNTCVSEVAFFAEKYNSLMEKEFECIREM